MAQALQEKIEGTDDLIYAKQAEIKRLKARYNPFDSALNESLNKALHAMTQLIQARQLLIDQLPTA